MKNNLIIKYIKFEEYPAIANAFLESANINRNSRFPLEIDVLSEKVGYKIEVFTNLFHDFGIRGCVIKKPGGPFRIGIDSDHYTNDEFFYPFTIAEELGHIHTHSSLFDEIETVQQFIEFNDCLSETDYRMMQNQARCVGSHILFPSFLFAPFLKEYCEENQKEIQSTFYYDSDDLANSISERIYKKIQISKRVVYFALIRYPDEPIRVVVDFFGRSLFGRDKSS